MRNSLEYLYWLDAEGTLKYRDDIPNEIRAFQLLINIDDL